MLMLGFLAMANASVKWLEKYEEASQQASAQNKYLLLFFTGSDWCGYCIDMEDKIFPSEEFEQYAKNNLILLKLDFPQRRSLSARQETQNKQLMDKYSINGFPKFILLNPQGDQVGKCGYPSEGLPQFMKWLRRYAPPVAQVALQPEATVAAPGTRWITDYVQAAQQTQTTHRCLLMAFTGSDWCGPCMRMETAVFASDTFKKYAAQKLILLSLDFPRQKTLPAALQNQNARLAKQYKVEGYPTVIILNDKGEVLDRLVGGFEDALPAFMRWLNRVVPTAKTDEEKAKEADGWTTDYAAAAQKAKDTRRPLLVAFTGSDWCGPCQTMEKNVYASDAFKAFARENLVLMQADYPQSAYQDKALSEQNAQLEQTYKIESFPTMILFDAQGNILARESGAFTSSDGFIDWLKKALKQ